MQPRGVKNGEMREIRGKKAVRKPRSRRKNARRTMTKAVRNAGRKNAIPRKRHESPPGTSNENNHKTINPVTCLLGLYLNWSHCEAHTTRGAALHMRMDDEAEVAGCVGRLMDQGNGRGDPANHKSTARFIGSSISSLAESEAAP